MVDFDTLLREALADDADRAPELPDTWTGPTVATRLVSTVSGSARRRRLYSVMLASVAAAATIAVFVVSTPGNDPPGEVEPAETGRWSPPGVEFPLEDLGVPDSNDLGVTVAGLSRSLGIEGHPPLVIASSLHYFGGATAEVHRCLSQSGGAGCAPEWNGDSPVIGITSSVDNGVADYDVWTWANVPAEAALVTYVDSPEMRWQRPVAGVVAFPDVAGSNEVAIAYTSNGVELARVDQDTIDAALEQVESPPLADVTHRQYEELTELTDTMLADCLTGHGARLDVSNVAVFPTGVDDIDVWNQCVATVEQVVADRVDEMNVTFYDPATQRPTASNPPFVFDEPVATNVPS